MWCIQNSITCRTLNAEFWTIYPEFIEMQKETAYEQMIEQNPSMTQEQIDQAMNISGMFMSPGFFSIMSVVGALFFGLIVSLIAGLIMRSDD